MAIAVYRYLLVCHANLLLGREAGLGRTISAVALLLPAALGMASLLFLSRTRDFLLCMGREEAFFYDLSDFLKRGCTQTYSCSPLNLLSGKRRPRAKASVEIDL